VQRSGSSSRSAPLLLLPNFNSAAKKWRKECCCHQPEKERERPMNG
jgi:hypothetical protein